MLAGMFAAGNDGRKNVKIDRKRASLEVELIFYRARQNKNGVSCIFSLDKS